jgi:dCMP deaminase
MHWDEYFFTLALTVARKSKDRSVQVGCVIVGPDHEIRSTGYNGFVRGADDDDEEWHQRPFKYAVTVHAELNAVCHAARIGSSLKGCEAFVTLPPCAACALALTQSGVFRVSMLLPPPWWKDGASFGNKWERDFAIAMQIFDTADIATRRFEYCDFGFDALGSVR